MRYHDIRFDDILNGPGFRTVLFVSGCDHHCPGCHNPETWDRESGEVFGPAELNEILDNLSRPEIDGLTLTGGDPLYPYNLEEITQICKQIKRPEENGFVAKWQKNKDGSVFTQYTNDSLVPSVFGDFKGKSIWVYTGSVYEIVKDLEIMKYIDVLVDGPFIESQKDSKLLFRGSKNQRLIDVPKTRESGSIILWED